MISNPQIYRIIKIITTVVRLTIGVVVFEAEISYAFRPKYKYVEAPISTIIVGTLTWTG